MKISNFIKQYNDIPESVRNIIPYPTNKNLDVFVNSIIEKSEQIHNLLDIMYLDDEWEEYETNIYEYLLNQYTLDLPFINQNKPNIEIYVDSIQHLISDSNYGFLGYGSETGRYVYKIDDNKIIKVTNEVRESIVAKYISENVYSKRLASIYDVKKLGNEIYILQEELLISNELIEKFDDIFEHENLHDCDSVYIDEVFLYDSTHNWNDEQIEIIEFVRNLISDFEMLGFTGIDIHSGNIGYSKETGKLKAFDITSFEDDYVIFNELLDTPDDYLIDYHIPELDI